MHLVVAYGFQGAEDDAEKLCLTDQLCDAVLCELAVGQPCVIAGDFNVEPTKVPCLLKGISAGLWVDLQGAWARAAGVQLDVTCKRDWASLGLHSAALGGCWVDCCRWIQQHLSVTASFMACRWTAKVTQPVRVSPLWPAFWVSAVDKSRNSISVEVTEIWEIYDRCLEFVPVFEAQAISDALAVTNVHLAWELWSAAAERALASAFWNGRGGRFPAMAWFSGGRRLDFWFVVLEAVRGNT